MGATNSRTCPTLNGDVLLFSLALRDVGILPAVSRAKGEIIINFLSSLDDSFWLVTVDRENKLLFPACLREVVTPRLSGYTETSVCADAWKLQYR